MPEQKPAQQTTVTVNEQAAVTGANIGDDNQGMTHVTPGGHAIQAKNSTVIINEPQRDLQNETALREAYLNRLLETCGQVLLSVIDRKTPEKKEGRLNLSGVYTALLTISSEETGLRAKDRGMFDNAPDRERQQLSAVAQLNRHKRLVLLGDPGSGKSTFVNFVALCLAGELLSRNTALRSAGETEADRRAAVHGASLQLLTEPLPAEQEDDKQQPERQPWQHDALLPVRVILRDFAAESLPPAGQPAAAKHLWTFIVRQLRESLLADYAKPLQRHLAAKGGLILLDGLDEVPEAHARRTQIKQAVEDFARIFHRCRFLVTSRTYAYQNQDWRLADFAETVLAPFTKPQIVRFVEQWYAQSADVLGMRPTDVQARAEALKRAILGNDRLYGFAQRPLLLTLMASLHAWRGGSLPEKREELYNDAVELLLDWWESRKVKSADGHFVSLSEALNLGREGLNRLRSAISALAFDAHAGQPDLVGTADIPGDKLAGVLRHLSRQTNCNPNVIEEYLRDRAGLLVEHGVDVYTFPHRTFQEYLAAWHVTEDQNNYPDNIAELARRDPDRWREVVLLAGAKAARGTPASIWLLTDALCYNQLPRTADLWSAEEADRRSAVREDAWGALFAAQTLLENANIDQIAQRLRPKVDLMRDWLIAILTEQVPFDSAQGKPVPFPAVERALAGNLLAQLGDPRPGVGCISTSLDDHTVGERSRTVPDIEWLTIPAGTFWMGSDPKKDSQAYPDEQPPHRVTLKQPFRISRYPVTNAQYQAFVDDGGYTEQWRACWTDEGWKWQEENDVTGPETYGGTFDLPNHPVVGVSWYEAAAFCQWLTQRLSNNQIIRLPSEAEWEYAARGTDGRIYPWNGEISPEYANYADTGLGCTSAVGCFPRGISPFGCEEMAGNVYEWCEDCWHDNYKGAPNDGRAWLSGGDSSLRVNRSGSWSFTAQDVRGAYRSNTWPDSRFTFLGFRVARTI